MFRRIGTLLLVVTFVLAGGRAAAQSRTTSALGGRVTDPEGKLVPGVAVTIESPQLIGGVRAAETDAKGSFHFSEIAPGIYTVRFLKSGFQTVVREQVRLGVCATTDLRIQLATRGLEETVVVTGELPGIDPTSSATSTSLDTEYLQNLPTSRFQASVLNLAPGINQDAAYGGGASSANSYQIDGVDVSDPLGGTAYAFFNYNLVEQVQLVGLGAPAEYGGFTGVVFNSLTKSGGNKFSGMGEFLYSNDALTGNNSDIPGIRPTIAKSFDSTFQMGGPIQHDKIWFFGSAQYLGNDQSTGGPVSTERDPRYFGKVTWQANSKNLIEGWIERDRFDVTGRGGDAVTPLEATVDEKSPETDWNLSWHATLGAGTVLQVAYTGWSGYFYLNPRNGYQTPGHYDGETGTYNTNSTYYYQADRNRQQVNASLSHHAADFIRGSHDFKFGMEIERSTVRDRYGYPGGVHFYDHYGIADDPGTAGDDPVPYSLAYTGHSYDVHATSKRLSAYAQDSWHLTPRLTINPGVRLDLNRGSVTNGTVFRTHPVAPRLGFAYDVTGDGKTLFKAHYGRYYEALFANYYYQLDSGAYTTGEIDRVFPSGYTDLLAEQAVGRYAIDPGLEHPFVDQFILGLDREVGTGLTLSVTGVWRKNRNFIETVSRDGIFVPVTGLVPDTGQEVTLYDYLNPGEDTLLITNPKGLRRTYEGLIVSATKRLRDRWQLAASFVLSRARGNIDNQAFGGSFGGNAGPSSFLDTPNSLVNAAGRLSNDQTRQLKLQGTYVVPKLHLSLSANYTYFSGDTWTRRTTCLMTDDGNDVIGDGILDCHHFPQGAVRYFAEARGSRRLSAHNEIDLRTEWYYQLHGGGRIGLALDLFNLTNQGRATSVTSLDGPNFGEPLAYNTPRNLRVLGRYGW